MHMRVLFASTQSTGHFAPLIPFAQACRDAGHEVLVAGPPPVAELAYRAALAHEAVAAAEPERLADVGRMMSGRAGFERVAIATTELFVGSHAKAALPDMLQLVEHWRPDVIARETAEVASLVAAEAHGVPDVRVGVALATPYEDWWLAMASGALDALRAEAGVPDDPGADRARRAPVLTQVPMALDEHQGDLPAFVRRYRVPVPTTAGPPLEWWEDRTAPLVPVSFGTVVPTDGHFPGLYREVVDALSCLRARVLVTVGRHADPAELGPLPANVHVERWVAQASVMPHAAAMVAHGGAGTTLAALAAGVPLVLLPLSADQPINARRVAELGAGLALDGGRADVPKLAQALARVLEEPAYGAAAGRVAAEVATLPAVAEAAADLTAIAQLQRTA
jgi:UDP:flavonoid glycosyltransferase YjiC (YdhE family)